MAKPMLSLLMQDIQAAEAGAMSVRRAAIACLAEELLAAGLWEWPIQVWARNKPGSKLALTSVEQLVEDALQRLKKGVLLADSAGTTRLEISDVHPATMLSCFSELGPHPEDDLLGKLVQAGARLWEAVRAEATVGPTFSIRPIGVDYPRPLPPRLGARWKLGEAAYFVSHRFHEENPTGDARSVGLMRSTDLPEQIVREELADLTIIRCKGPAEEEAVFAKQRYDLEIWLSSLLDLPVDPEFRENGDKRVAVIGKEDAEPFTFYDPMTGTAYKGVTQSEATDIDKDESTELKRVLAVRSLANGQLVHRMMAVFPTREAAVHNREAVVALGADGAVYLGDEGEVWDPRPGGNWIATDGRRPGD